MQIFEYPYIIITIFTLCFIILGGIGIYFAIRGVKLAGGHTEKDFATISKLESDFNKTEKKTSNRCVLYIGLFSNNLNELNRNSKIFPEIKEILLQTFSNGDDSDIAAYGEKHFVALLNRDNENLKKNITDFQAQLSQILLKHSLLNIVSVSFGAYYGIGADVNFDDAIARAKQALIIAKNGKTHYAEWDVDSGKALEKKIKIENYIEKEIDNNSFFLEYQPVIDAKTKKIIGAEVLSRLNSESDGVLTPGSFLSAVDSVGINQKFDYYIFEKNCKWISNDKSQRENYKFTINFSRSTLSEPEFVEKITNIANKYDLKFSCLAVEVLEDKNISGEAKQQMINNLSVLKEKGVSILLDDFGSGYTTFGDLQNLDISIVKIDKEITRNSLTKTGFIILKNLIKTTKDIGFKTLCEGIETKEMEEAAIKAGCDFLQGFYYYRPMSVSNLETLFDKE